MVHGRRRANALRQLGHCSPIVPWRDWSGSGRPRRRRRAPGDPFVVRPTRVKAIAVVLLVNASCVLWRVTGRQLPEIKPPGAVVCEGRAIDCRGSVSAAGLGEGMGRQQGNASC